MSASGLQDEEGVEGGEAISKPSWAPAEPKSDDEYIQRMSTVDAGKEAVRMLTGIAGLDQCLAESDESPPGLPLGTSVLLSGMPGGGKSSIALFMAAAAKEAMYFHGEERRASLKRRWDRFRFFEKKGAPDPWLSRIMDTEGALNQIRTMQPLMTVVDSVQTLSHEGGRSYDDQLLAAEAIVGQACGSGGSVVLVSHVTKNGREHAGAQGLAHLVDVHLHVAVNAKNSTRQLEVRKNRCGRAGFQVPLNIGLSSLTCGAPAAMTEAGARNSLERMAEKAWEWLVEGEPLDFYDFDEAGASSPGIWRAGLEMAVKRLQRAGYGIDDSKVKGRRTFRMVTKPGDVVEEPQHDPPMILGPGGAPLIELD